MIEIFDIFVSARIELQITLLVWLVAILYHVFKDTKNRDKY
jgi:hypothetical protein